MTHEANFPNSDDLDSNEENKDRELYEREKTLLLRFLIKAKSSLDTSEPAQQALEPNEACLLQLRSTLDELKDLLKAMTDLNYKLRRKVSRKQRQELRKEIAEFDECFSGVEKQLNVRLEALEAAVTGWKDWYRRLHEFCDWLVHAQSRLGEMQNSHSADGFVTSLETCVQEAQVLHDQVHKNRDTLKHLEEDFRNMTSATAYSSDLERSPLASNLHVIRLKWELLRTGSRDFIYKVFASSLAQFQKLTHWRSYGELKKHLVLWLGEAERRCSGHLTAGSVTSREEAVNLCQSHRALLHEHKERHTTLRDMQLEADNLVDHPAMREELDSIQNRWDSLGSALEDRSDCVRTLCSDWLSPEDISNMLVTNTEGEELPRENFSTPDTSAEAESEGDSVADPDRRPRLCDKQLSSAEASAEENTASEHPSQQTQQQDATHTGPEEAELTSESNQPEANHRQKPKGVRAIFDALISKHVNQDKKSTAESAPEPKRKKPDMTRLPETEVTVRTLQKCVLQSSQAIFPHQVTARLDMLKSALSDYKNHTSDAQNLQQDLEDFLEENNNNDADDAHPQRPHKEAPPPVTASSASRYLKLLRRLAKIGDMLEARVTVCRKWIGFSDSLGSVHDQLQSLQDRLMKSSEKSADSAEGVEGIKSEVEKVRKTLRTMSGEVVGLGRWMSSTQLQVKDPKTHDLMQPMEQIQELDRVCDTIEHMTQTESQPEELQETDPVHPSEQPCTGMFDENEVTPQKEKIVSRRETEDTVQEVLSSGQPYRECEDEIIQSKEDISSSEHLGREVEERVPTKAIPSYRHFSQEYEDGEIPAKEETLSSEQSHSEGDGETDDQSYGEIVVTPGEQIAPQEENITFDPSGRKIVLASGEDEDTISSDEGVNCSEC